MHRIPLDDEDCFTFSEVDAMHKQAVWEITWALVLTEEEPASPERLLIEAAFDEHVGAKTDGEDGEEQRKRGREGDGLPESSKRVALSTTNREAENPLGWDDLPPELVYHTVRLVPTAMRAFVNPSVTRMVINVAYDMIKVQSRAPREITDALLTPHVYARVDNPNSPEYDPGRAEESRRAIRMQFILGDDSWKVGFGRLSLCDKMTILRKIRKTTGRPMEMIANEHGQHVVGIYLSASSDILIGGFFRDSTIFLIEKYINYRNQPQNASIIPPPPFYVIVMKNTPLHAVLYEYAQVFNVDESMYLEHFDDFPSLSTTVEPIHDKSIHVHPVRTNRMRDFTRFLFFPESSTNFRNLLNLRSEPNARKISTGPWTLD